MRFFPVFALLVSLISPLSAAMPAAAQVATGSLAITLLDENGSAVPGGCFTILDGTGASYPACDDDLDGLTQVGGLAEGTATIQQTSGPDGYSNDSVGYATVVADQVTSAQLAVTTITVPTPEPTVEVTPAETATATAEPTETATDEPAATETATAEPTEIATSTVTPTITSTAGRQQPSLAAADDDRALGIDCSYSPNEGVSSFHVTVTQLPENPDGEVTVVLTAYDNFMNPLEPITYHGYDSGTQFESKPWRQITITVTWPDGVIADAQAACNTSRNAVNITTISYDTDGNAIPNGGGINAGTAFRDTAVLSGNTIDAIGTATYNLYAGAACTGAPVFTQSVEVTGGVIPSSDLYTPTANGLYRWQVSYSGDEKNAPATSGCDTEQVIVGKLQPSIRTRMVLAGPNSEIPDNGTVQLDASVFDQAILSGLSANASGTVTYNLYAGSDCSGAPVHTSTANVVNGAAGDSEAFSFPSAGVFNWQVTYSGDALNESVTSDCGSETFTVGPRTTSVTTVMYNASGEVIADGAVVSVGSQIRDSAILAGVTADAGGSVTFNLYKSASCTGTPVYTFAANVVNGAVEQTDLFTFPTEGVYNWQAVYSGDARNNGSSSLCGTETATAQKRSPSVTTVMHDGATNAVIPDEGIVLNGSTIYDTATLSGASELPTGTVTYTLYHGYNCTSGEIAQTFPAQNLNSDGTLPQSPTYTLATPGTYNWVVTYSGDAANNGASSLCGSEEFFVEQGDGGISTQTYRTANNSQLSDDFANGIDFGTGVYDTSKLSGFTPDAGGTVTYSLYAGTDCTATPIFTSTVNVTNGVVPNSESYDFPDKGTFNWQASYSGDAHNMPAKSACGSETVLVFGKTVSLTTVMYDEATGNVIADNAGLLIPTQIYDTVAITGGTADLAGTVTFNLYNNVNCSGTPILASAVSFSDRASIGASETTTVSNPLVYNWQAVYSGDDLNRTGKSACGTETVYGQTQPTITTTIKAANGSTIEDGGTIAIDALVGDSATLHGASATAGGTVTFNLYDNASCTGTPLFAPTVNVTNGTVANSPTHNPYYTGTYEWQAVYSGDQFNRTATSECGTETFTVDGPVTIPTTVMYQAQTVVLDDGFVTVGKAVTDSATIRGTSRTADGTIVYNLYPNADCSGTPVFTSTKTVTDAVAQHSDAFTLPEYGTYNWVVSFIPEGASEPVAFSACGSETIRAIANIDHKISINCLYSPATGNSSFTVNLAKLRSDAPGTDPELAVIAHPFAIDLSPLTDISYNDYNSGTLFSNKQWRLLKIDVTWPDQFTGTASAGCNSTKLQPQISTVMTSNNQSVSHPARLALGDLASDTVRLTKGTVAPTGTITYKLYRNADCSGSPVFQALNLPIDGANLPVSGNYTIPNNGGGTYNWVVTYSGDTYNKPVTSACGSETFFVGDGSATITTAPKDSNGSVIADGGTVTVGSAVVDSATIATGYQGAIEGTVTYNLYETSDCSGDPIFTIVKRLSANTVPDSAPYTITEVGTYEWQAIYSGSQFIPTAIGSCGDETIVVTPAEPTITTLLSAETVSTGDAVNDTAILHGATANAGGTVTYFVYTTADCSGDPLYTFGPYEVVNGVVPNSDSQIFDIAGTYEWQAVYSGDANNKGATGTCGDETLVVQAPSLSIVKTADATVVNAGQAIGFTITVTNAGPGVAHGVTLSDTLPATNDWTIDANASSADCAIDNGSLTCEPRDLGNGEQLTVHITAMTELTQCEPVKNVASFDSTNGGTGESNEATITINCATLSIEKTADAAVVSAGDQIGFTVTVHNDGPGIGYGTTLSDALPAGFAWTIDSARSNSSCSLNGLALECGPVDLANGADLVAHVTAPTSQAQCGTITNVASYDSTYSGSGESEEASIEIQCPDLSIKKTADAESVSAGDRIGFSITVSNAGPGRAYGVAITDQLPARFTWTIDRANTTANCAIASQTLSCAPATVAAGGSLTVHITASTTPALCGTISNVASFSATNAPSESSESVSIQILCPDLRLQKTADKETVSAGDQIGFTITVTNIGAGIARNVNILDTLPNTPGLSWTLDTQNSSAGCLLSNGSVICLIGNLAPGATVTVHVVSPTTPNSCDVISNTATTFASNERVFNILNNFDDATVTVECPNVVVKKTAVTGVISAGDAIAFDIQVQNSGRGTAANVTISDPLPAGSDWSVNDQRCTISQGTLNCALGSLASQGTVTIRVSGTTDAADCGVVSNTVTVAASNEPSNAGQDNTSTATVTVNCPDIVLTKTAKTGTITAGDDAVFTLTVTNSGAGIARNVTLSDTLPAGINWSVDNENCTIANGTLSCEFGDLDPAASRTVTLTGTTDADDCGLLPNSASVQSTNEASAQTGNNTSSATIAVNCAELDFAKLADTDTVSAGDAIGFTLTLKNTGNGEARSVSLHDVLPTNAGLAWTIDGGTDAEDCAIANGALDCDFGTVPANSSVSVHISSPTTAASCGVVDNTAEITTSNAGNADAADSVTVLCPNVVITKVAGSARISAGDQISFTITATNTGAGAAKHVVVSDTLPTGIAWTEESADCSIANGVLTCTYDVIPSLGSKSVTVHATVPASACGEVSNTATVTADNEPEESTGDNSATATVTVDCPDLELTKTAANSTINAGDEASFTISVTNNGLGMAKQVVISDTLKAGTDWTIDPQLSECAIANGALTCQLDELAPQATFSVTVRGVVSAAECGELVNEASVTLSNGRSEDTSDDSDSATVMVNCPNLTIEKVADAETISASDTIGFAITVTNDGEGIARSVVVTDVLPAGFDWTVDNDACAIADGTLSCDFGDFNPADTGTVHLTAPTAATNCGVVTNTATVDAGNLSPDQTDEERSSTATVTVNCPDLAVTKVADDAAVNATDAIGFTIELTNGGNGTAYNATLTDVLPVADGIAWAVDGGTGAADCAITDGTLSCDFGDLEPGAIRTVHVASPTTAGTCGDVVNTVDVAASNEAMTDLDNNTASATTTVNCPDIEVVKVADAQSITVGDTIGFSITVTNTGVGTAYDVTLNDPLTSAVTWTLDGDDAANCAIANGELTCDFGDLASGESRSVHISGETDSADCGTISNTVTVVAGNEAEIATGNNTSTDTVTITCASVVVIKTGDNGNGGTDPLENACFQLLNGDNVVAEACTDETGQITFDHLPVATYVLHEVSAPADYQTVADSAPFTLTAGEIKSITLNDPLTTIEFSVYKLNCETDPGDLDISDVAAGNLPDGCELVEGVSFSVTEYAGAPTTATTDANGVFTVDATLYSTIAVTEQVETATPGYAPIRQTLVITEAQADQAGLVFVNIPQEGNVDIAKYLCVTDGDSYTTEFEVTSPRGASDRGAGCSAGADIAFTITGDLLDEPLHLTTDLLGLAHATLRVGTYTIVEDSTGASTTFMVTADKTVLVSVFNMIPEPSAAVIVTKVWCDADAATGGIIVNPDAIPAGCVLGDAVIQIDGGTPVHFGSDGVMSIDLANGEHTIFEPSTGYEKVFTVSTGSTPGILIVNINGGETVPTPEATPGPGASPTPETNNVKEFPNTGTGTDNGGNESGFAMFALLLLAMLTFGGLGIAARRTKHTSQPDR